MQTIRNQEGKEILVFTDSLDPKAMEQIKQLSDFGVYRASKIRIMPDAHAGKGCTIGTTMTITDKVTPNLVGVDIGCGMLVIKLNNREIHFPTLERTIRTSVPHGMNIHQNPVKDFDLSQLRCLDHADVGRASRSLGSLGGGNHFIEVGKGEKTQDIYLVIHSGSRKLGNDVCNYYQKKAVKHNPSAKHLAYLSGRDFDDYMNDMAIVQKYATVNRETIAEIIMEAMQFTATHRFETIHNYIDFDRMILRKGAVRAEHDELLLIPVNMRDGSILCSGKGNENWNYSAPHGAGRLYSRRKAKESLNMETFVQSMKGIYTESVSAKTLDESPQAYKPIEEILSSLEDTVKIREVIKPLYNFKAP